MDPYQQSGYSSQAAEEYRRRREQPVDVPAPLFAHRKRRDAGSPNYLQAARTNPLDYGAAPSQSHKPGVNSHNTTLEQPTLPPTLSNSPSFQEMLLEKWTASTTAVHTYHLETALRLTKSPISSCISESTRPPFFGLLLANRGILHWTLGEHAPAFRYLGAAIDACPGMAVMRFLFGCVAFEMGRWTVAWRAFESCVECFGEECKGGGAGEIDYSSCGLEFVLKRSWVRENMDVAHGKCVGDDGTVGGIWRMPGLRVFEPLGGDGGRRFGGALEV